MSEEWETVKSSKKKTSPKGRQTAAANYPLDQEVSLEEIDKGVEAIKRYSEALKHTSFYKDTIAYFHQSQLNLRISKIIALGLGSFQKVHSSLQLSFLIALQEDLNLTIGQVDVCDPVMTEGDIRILHKFKLRSIPNLSGKYQMNGAYTLFFMPHCPYRLYSNVIWSNWDALGSVLILGNSFEGYRLRQVRTDDDATDCVGLVHDLCEETVLWNNAKHIVSSSRALPDEFCFLQTAFNDFSAMKFPSEKLIDEIWVRMSNCKPTEAALDVATAADIEIFPRDVTTEKRKFGHLIREHFQLSPGFTNLNHGSFGATPKVVTARQIELMALQEAHPDRWFRKTYYEFIAASRARLAALVNAPLEDLVLIENASAAVNSVLRSYPFCAGEGILRLNTAYSMVIDTVRWMVRTIGIEDVVVDLEFPINSPQQILDAVEQQLKTFDKVKLCIFSHISSMPTMIEPVKELTALCHRYGALVMIDGAHAPGQIAVDVQDINADFYLGNCHKWLFSVRFIYP